MQALYNRLFMLLAVCISGVLQGVTGLCVGQLPRVGSPISPWQMSKATLVFAGLSGRASVANTWKLPLQDEVAADSEFPHSSIISLSSTLESRLRTTSKMCINNKWQRYKKFHKKCHKSSKELWKWGVAVKSLISHTLRFKSWELKEETSVSLVVLLNLFGCL